MKGKDSDDRAFDGIDALVASALAVGVALWAFLWGHPFPGPSHWSSIAAAAGLRPAGDFVSGMWSVPAGRLVSMLGMSRALAAMAIAGRLSLGVFAALAYLAFRSVWQSVRHPEDAGEDVFFHTRFVPMCAAMALVLFPPLWRQGQFPSPDFLHLSLFMLACLFWLRGRARRNVVPYAAAWLLAGMVCGENPVACIGAFAMAIADSVTRRRLIEEWGSGDSELDFRDDRRERYSGALMFAAGVAFSLWLNAHGNIRAAATWGALARNAWAGVKTTFSGNGIFTAAFVPVAAFVASSLGHRLRRAGESLGWLRVVLSSVAGAIAAVALAASVDMGERTALARLKEFAELTAESSAGTRLLFTDGALDDALRIAISARGGVAEPVSVIRPPSEKERQRLKSIAPSPGDAAIFAEGGSDIFKAWLPEKPERMKSACWQLGMAEPALQRPENGTARTSGTVARIVAPEMESAADALDAKAMALSRAAAESAGTVRGAFSWASAETCDRYDVMLWRLARLADVRRTEAGKKPGGGAAVRINMEIAQALDRSNMSLHVSGGELDKLLPTANLVPTPREGLWIALKRRDFSLARPYALGVIASDPADVDANFALGMDCYLSGDYKTAVRHLETVLASDGGNVFILNNLAVSYVKRGWPGDREKAISLMEKAVAAKPDEAALAETLKRMREEEGAGGKGDAQ
ncbi:MAG: hypothetical protein K6F50_03125 [Kiritimatiellae bacterium]|nr:hypothetical protein [Kiritimatiellia bacterium]